LGTILAAEAVPAELLVLHFLVFLSQTTCRTGHHFPVESRVYPKNGSKMTRKTRGDEHVGVAFEGAFFCLPAKRGIYLSFLGHSGLAQAQSLRGSDIKEKENSKKQVYFTKEGETVEEEGKFGLCCCCATSFFRFDSSDVNNFSCLVGSAHHTIVQDVFGIMSTFDESRLRKLGL